MKEIESITISNKPNIEVSVKKQQQIQRELVGKIVPFQGHKIWEINIETLEVKEAQFIVHTIEWYGQKSKKEIIINKGYAYVSALNKVNALKQYIKGNNGSKCLNSNPISL